MNPERQPRPTRGPAQHDALLAIRRHCAESHDLITHRQLRTLGLSERRIERWAEAGLLVRRHRWVFSLGSLPLSHLDLGRSAVMSVGGNAYLAGRSAASALDLTTFPARPVHVLSDRRSRPQPGVVVREHFGLAAHEITDVAGVPCSSTARTLFDLAGVEQQSRLDAMVDRAIHLRLLDRRAIDQVVAARPTLAGAAPLAAAIARLDLTAGRNRTELERIVIELINSSDITPAANNVRIAGSEVDVHWVGTRAIIEADGRDGHSSPAQIAADLAKQQKLEALGFRFMWVTWPQARYEPERTLARAAAFLAANLEPPVPGPPALDACGLN